MSDANESAHSDPLDPAHLMAHVQDSEYFEVPRILAPANFESIEDVPAALRAAHPDWTLEQLHKYAVGKVILPQPFKLEKPILAHPPIIEPLDFKLTKFMVLEVVAFVLLSVVFIRLARKISTGERPKGRMWNLLEAMLLFIRDEVARPAIGKHDADKFLPFLWSMFFFVLTCNLLGLLPWAGSATGSIATTGCLALITFGTVVGVGMAKLGPGHFWLSLVPHMDLPKVLMVFLWPMLFAIELLGLLIKHFVLSVRLMANMMAGHLVLAVIVAFIAASANSYAFYGVTPASIAGAVALNLLELFVAFLQAYIFTFLSALFIGSAVHPH